MTTPASWPPTRRSTRPPGPPCMTGGPPSWRRSTAVTPSGRRPVPPRAGQRPRRRRRASPVHGPGPLPVPGLLHGGRRLRAARAGAVRLRGPNEELWWMFTIELSLALSILSRTTEAEELYDQARLRVHQPDGAHGRGLLDRHAVHPPQRPRADRNDQTPRRWLNSAHRHRRRCSPTGASGPSRARSTKRAGPGRGQPGRPAGGAARWSTNASPVSTSRWTLTSTGCTARC